MKYEYLVVGTGVAAAAFVERLLQSHPHAAILMLEVGGRLAMRDYATYQDYLVTGVEPHAAYWDLPYPAKDAPGENYSVGNTPLPLNGSRLTMYGGSTVHWGGWSFRLKPEDFHLHSSTGQGIDWPFGYEELEPYYGAAERYIGVSGDSNDGVVPRSQPYPFREFPYTLEDGLMIAGLRAKGVPYSHMPIARQGIDAGGSWRAPCQTTGTCKYCPFGARYVAANFLDHLVGSGNHPNLQIRTGIRVDRIRMSSRRRAEAVEAYDRNTGEICVFEADEIVVASGGIESPKLLQRSVSSFWPNGLGNDLGLVGRHLITHPYFIFEATLPANPLRLQPEMGFPTLISRHFDSPAEQARGKFILVHPNGSPKVDLAGLMKSGRSKAEILEAVSGPVAIQMHGILEVFSDPASRVTDSPVNPRTKLPELNHLGLFQSRVEYNRSPDFDARMAEIGTRVSGILEAAGGNQPALKSISWRADHAACTTRMSRDPKDGVVDANLAIHDVENVHVCSNASFASLGAVNPTLTLTALALRLADHLAGRSLEAGSTACSMASASQSGS